MLLRLKYSQLTLVGILDLLESTTAINVNIIVLLNIIYICSVLTSTFHRHEVSSVVTLNFCRPLPARKTMPPREIA